LNKYKTVFENEIFFLTINDLFNLFQLSVYKLIWTVFYMIWAIWIYICNENMTHFNHSPIIIVPNRDRTQTNYYLALLCNCKCWTRTRISMINWPNLNMLSKRWQTFNYCWWVYEKYWLTFGDLYHPPQHKSSYYQSILYTLFFTNRPV